MKPYLVFAFASAVLSSCSLSAAERSSPIAFEKRVLNTLYFCDGVTAGDINRDGKTDVIAGPFWYAGPDFKAKHEFYPAEPIDPAPSPSNSMFSWVHDFNGDGWPDILVLGRVHLHQAFWYENPQGKPGLWKKYFAFHRVQGETPPFLDVDGDGKPELVAHWENHWGLIQPNWTEPAKPWLFKPITVEGQWHHFYHGTGMGDVNGDGRLDLILNEGWFEQPAEKGAMWKENKFKFAERGGAQMFAYDVEGDGDNDIITALDAHGWGLAWFEHVRENGAITFRKHMIMGDRAEEQKYGIAFTLADVDGDGLKDIVTGKRRWAHGPNGDIEPMADPVNYWFQLVRSSGGGGRFVPHLIDKESGLGVQITVNDVNADGRPDVLTASKLGTFVFLNNSAAKK
jgi:hypothetical protein